MLRVEGFETELERSLARSEMLKYHFRNAAQTGLMVYRNFFDQQKSVRKLAWSTEVIFNVLQQYEPDHILMREARRDTLRIFLDTAGALAFLHAQSSKPLRLKPVEKVPPLSFAMYATKIKEALLVEDPWEVQERLFHHWWSAIEGVFEFGNGNTNGAWRDGLCPVNFHETPQETRTGQSPSLQSRGATISSKEMITMNRARLELLPGLWLDARRAVWMEQERALLVADLHLGYAWAHRQQGNLMPIGSAEDTLDRLQALASEYAPREIIVLGDIVHAAVTEEAVLADLRRLNELGAVVSLIAGNHDSQLALMLRRAGVDAVLRREIELGGHLLLHGDFGDEAMAEACCALDCSDKADGSSLATNIPPSPFPMAL